MLSRLGLGNHVRSLGLAGNGALDGLFGGFIVVVMDLAVVFGFPMDEDANADEQVIGFGGGNGAIGNTVGHGLGHTGLGWAKHLNRLSGAFDGHFVEHHGSRLGHQVRGNNSQKGVVASRLVCQTTGKASLCGGATGANEQVDMSNFVAVTNQ